MKRIFLYGAALSGAACATNAYALRPISEILVKPTVEEAAPVVERASALVPTTVFFTAIAFVAAIAALLVVFYLFELRSLRSQSAHILHDCRQLQNGLDEIDRKLQQIDRKLDCVARVLQVNPLTEEVVRKDWDQFARESVPLPSSAPEWDVPSESSKEEEADAAAENSVRDAGLAPRQRF